MLLKYCSAKNLGTAGAPWGILHPCKRPRDCAHHQGQQKEIPQLIQWGCSDTKPLARSTSISSGWHESSYRSLPFCKHWVTSKVARHAKLSHTRFLHVCLDKREAMPKKDTTVNPVYVPASSKLASKCQKKKRAPLLKITDKRANTYGKFYEIRLLS